MCDLFLFTRIQSKNFDSFRFKLITQIHRSVLLSFPFVLNWVSGLRVFNRCLISSFLLFFSICRHLLYNSFLYAFYTMKNQLIVKEKVARSSIMSIRRTNDREESENQHSTVTTTRISCFFIILFCNCCCRCACMMTTNFSMWEVIQLADVVRRRHFLLYSLSFSLWFQTYIHTHSHTNTHLTKTRKSLPLIIIYDTISITSYISSASLLSMIVIINTTNIVCDRFYNSQVHD